jgi:osmoprotectant transport system substrate-binding protein
MAHRRVLAALAALLLALVVAGCGGGDGDDTQTKERSDASDSPLIRLGAKNFTEQAILGELYRQALEAKGFGVDFKPDIGSTEIIHRALRRDALDLYPEYVGVLLSEVAKVTARPRSAEAAYEAAKEYEAGNGYVLLDQTPFADSNALGVKPAFAARHRLRTIADLKRLKGTVKIGALPEFRTRFEGLDGLSEVYGLRNLQVSAVDSGARYEALDKGRVDIISVFTTDSQLAGSTYTVLDDPRGLFASGHVEPIISEKVLREHGPRLRETIDAVTKTLTTPAMRQMNAAVDVGGRTAAAVAKEFLAAKNLL